MKRQLKLLAALMLTGVLSMATSCDNNKKPEAENPEDAQELAVSATDDLWHYFSFTTGAEVGKGAEDATDNAAWFARKDWDIAFKKSAIRTNSGAATTVGAQGGVYTFAEDVTFANANLPNGAVFVADKVVKEEAMGHDGFVETVKSEATVILFKKNAAGEMIMPPVYQKAPVYAFRTADGLGIYKVEFTQYKDAEGVSGKILFNVQKMN
ncbi:MAG: HmuY family protein [Bacteroidales bacterium]|nr:HmuY family protein [Bacteroidales bacterium]